MPLCCLPRGLSRFVIVLNKASLCEQRRCQLDRRQQRQLTLALCLCHNTIADTFVSLITSQITISEVGHFPLEGAAKSQRGSRDLQCVSCHQSSATSRSISLFSSPLAFRLSALHLLTNYHQHLIHNSPIHIFLISKLCSQSCFHFCLPLHFNISTSQSSLPSELSIARIR